MPERASKARSKPTLLGNPVPTIPLPKAEPAAKKPRPIPKRPLPPKLPPAALMPPLPKTSRSPKMKLVIPRPSAAEPKAIPADGGTLIQTRKPAIEAPEEVDPEVAFNVEPTPRPVVPPPLPKPAAIPLEHKAAPELLPVAERSDEKPIPPRLLSSLPPPPLTPDMELRSPFEPVASPAPAEAAGFDGRSAGIGFAAGAALVALIAFVLWPSASTPSASNLTDTRSDDPVATRPIAEEPIAEEPVAEEPVAEEPVAEEPVVEPRPIARPRARPHPARPRPATRPQPRPRPVVAARPRRRTDGPVIDSEPTTRPIRRPAPSGNRPATPTRQDVAGAIQAIRPQLRACAPDLRGHVANVRFTFVSSGRATSALVPNSFGSPQARSCVARVARQARVPAFSDPRLVVTYPVQF